MLLFSNLKTLTPLTLSFYMCKKVKQIPPLQNMFWNSQYHTPENNEIFL